jgi:hypothetical protein
MSAKSLRRSTSWTLQPTSSRSAPDPSPRASVRVVRCGSLSWGSGGFTPRTGGRDGARMNQAANARSKLSMSSACETSVVRSVQ